MAKIRFNNTHLTRSVGTVSSSGIAGQVYTTATHTKTIDNPNTFSTSQNDYFGWVVDISGNYAIVGAPFEDVAGGNDSGNAYIVDVTTGNLIHTLDNPSAYSTSPGDQFGRSVAISGNYAIVGAFQEDDASGDGSGKAYIFDVTTGNLLHTLDNPNAYSTSGADKFGWSVAIDDTYAIVSAYNEDDDGGTQSGKVYIFDTTTGNLLHTLDNPNAYGTSASDAFGWSVSVSGNYTIVGARDEDDITGFSSGKAYIFDVTTGNLAHTLDNPNAYDTGTNDYFGEHVAIDGNYAIVGAHYEDDTGGFISGKAYIFDVTTGNLLHTLDNPNAFSASGNDRFGFSVSIDGNYTIVGAYGEDDQPLTGSGYSGKAYIFDVTTGNLVATLDNPNAFSTSVNDNFSCSVAISNNHVIVGAFAEGDAAGNYSGKAYIFELS